MHVRHVIENAISRISRCTTFYFARKCQRSRAITKSLNDARVFSRESSRPRGLSVEILTRVATTVSQTRNKLYEHAIVFFLLLLLFHNVRHAYLCEYSAEYNIYEYRRRVSRGDRTRAVYGERRGTIANANETSVRDIFEHRPTESRVRVARKFLVRTTVCSNNRQRFTLTGKRTRAPSRSENVGNVGRIIRSGSSGSRTSYGG